ncbi:PGPGW domain-containing protein [Roseospirillum parvum]|uniref:Putative transmembrane protein (PGPGW) n=1 Tax=Roseospirillum parvum TaxID=83401 RepID=A0A1G7V4N6_9PROT|nr:PGPGW domain-containing protein [Roseospirillum parvum]SDG54714.1 Putative transmembrane protein (PGPGW) [Roseospirillum parvum]
MDDPGLKRPFGNRFGRAVLGWVLLVVGAIITPTPIPIGIFVMAFAVYLLARDSLAVRQAVRWARRNWPAFCRALEGIKHRLPHGVRESIDITHPDHPEPDHRPEDESARTPR